MHDRAKQEAAHNAREMDSARIDTEVHCNSKSGDRRHMIGPDVDETSLGTVRGGLDAEGHDVEGMRREGK